MGAFEDKLGCPFCRDHDLPPAPALEKAWRIHRERHEIGEVTVDVESNARERWPDDIDWTNVREYEYDVERQPWVNRSFEDYFQLMYDQALAILIERQRKYGPENIERQGLFGIFTRLRDDKMARISKLMNGLIVNGRVELEPRLSMLDDATLTDESVEDTLIDIANYAFIMLAVYRGDWCPPLREEMDA